MLLKILSAPLLAPLQFVEWIGGTIENAVQAQLHDTDAIKAELTVLEKKFDSGDMSEAEFEELELGLVMRLQAAARRMAAAGGRA